MNMAAAMWLGLLGSVCGVAYAVLGIFALKHLPDADELDRTVGWTLWWWLERNRCSPEGKKLCNVGAVLMVLAMFFWTVAFFLMRRP